MTVTTTDLRKNLFQLVEKSVSGETVEFTHKGRTIRLVPEQTSSKWDRLTTRPLINMPDVEEGLSAQSHEVTAAWEDKWAKR